MAKREQCKSAENFKSKNITWKREKIGDNKHQEKPTATGAIYFSRIVLARKNTKDEKKHVNIVEIYKEM